MSDEFDRIAKLRARFSQWTPSQVRVGIGDDAAVLHWPSADVVLSVDTAVDGVHFTRALASLTEIGARAFSAAISDLAAMGAQPSAALSSLIVPAAMSLPDFDALTQGIAAAAADYGCPVVGGNLSSGRELSLTTTVVGALAGPGMLRSGARLGDRIYVTGTLGDAALGLVLLQRGAAERGPEFVARWRAPRARIAEGLKLVGHASAAIDVSDGALQDLGHICTASDLGAEINAERVPLRPGFAELATDMGQDPLALALFGGEDYELIYTLPESAQIHAIGTCIGRIVASSNSVRVLDEKGGILPLAGHGYRHFEGCASLSAMQKTALRALLEAVKAGDVQIDAALNQLRDLPFADLGFANVDHHRALRVGLPEVVFGMGKTAEQISGIVREMRAKGHPALVTRVDAEKAEALKAVFPSIEHDVLGRTLLLRDAPAPVSGRGPVCVVSAGTSDLPVAREAIVTAQAFGNEVTELHDVGVAGLHRLLARREVLYRANVLIVIAGMEGALASVVGGLVSRPVIAVPTSIGYGAAFGGVAALLAMLNSCASGVTVVNIDNGFGAAYAATLINQVEG